MESTLTQFGCRDMNLDLHTCLTNMKSFYQLLQKPTKKVIGLMSGTSVDGVDAALVEIRGHGLETKIELLAFHSHPFKAAVRDRIFDLFQPETSRVDELCQMNFLIGEVFAEAALSVIREVGLEPWKK